MVLADTTGAISTGNDPVPRLRRCGVSAPADLPDVRRHGATQPCGRRRPAPTVAARAGTPHAHAGVNGTNGQNGSAQALVEQVSTSA
ncbi:MAG: hypothetical protein R2838_13435 [Caldilineaceae bacterium]